MTNRVFISYETTTGLNLARHLSVSLSKLNFPSFIAERDIRKGDDWRETIDKALSDCEIFILIATNLALNSSEVLKEVNYAVDNCKEIIPCKKSNVSDEKLFSSFSKISKRQKIDFKDEFELSDAVIEALINREIHNQNESRLSFSYSNIEKLGSGGFGEVYKAIRRLDNETVVINVVNRTDHNGRKIITNSASVWLTLKHKNIVELTGVNFSPMLYLEQEYCDSSLSQILFPLGIKEAVSIMKQLCSGIGYAHNLGIVHGDLKPMNVLFKSGEVKIADWGFCIDTNSKRSETMIFTPDYASPEQLKFETIDTRTDLYQLGRIFYEMMTNRNPKIVQSDVLTDTVPDRTVVYNRTMAFSDYLDNLIDKNKITTDIEKPTMFNPEAKKVEPIILKLLQEDKINRYQSITELVNDLNNVAI